MVSSDKLAVKLFKARSTTENRYYFVDPNVHVEEVYRKEIEKAVERVSKARGLSDDWFDDECKALTPDGKRMGLFLQAVNQDTVVFKGAHLVLYAAPVDWQLERKLCRITTGTDKILEANDIKDAVALIKLIKGEGPPLSRLYFDKLDYTGWKLPLSLGIAKVRREYARIYGEAGIASSAGVYNRYLTQC